MQIIIPLSGIGKRFIDAGYNIPKPLIEVDGMPMIEHVVNLCLSNQNLLLFHNVIYNYPIYSSLLLFLLKLEYLEM